MKTNKPDSPLSILLLGTQMEMGGAQSVLFSQARWLQARGHHVQVVYLYDKLGLEDHWQAQNAFPVINLHAWKSTGFIAMNLLRLLRGAVRLFIIARGGVQIIETFTTHSNLIGLPVAWVARVPVRIASLHGILRSRGDLLPRLHGQIVNSGLASILVVVSTRVQDYAIERERVRPERIQVIKNGIEALEKALLSVEQRRQLRHALAVSEDNRMLLTVGRLVPAKGHSVLLQAFASLPDRFSDVVCVLAGDGELLLELQTLARQLGIMNRMRFLGTRQDVPQLLYGADIFVQPSLSEGLSIAMLEAMSVGLPVVATRVGAAGEVIEDGVNGLLVPAGDPEALAAALQDVLDDSPLRTRLGRAARERVVAAYGVESMCTAYEELMRAQLAEAVA